MIPPFEFIDKEWYKKLEEPHIRPHQIVATLLESIRKGNLRPEIMLQVRRLTEESITVISILQEIEYEFMPMFGADNQASNQ